MHPIFETIGVIAAIVLPVWNIPLIARVLKRKSSRDISIHWAVGAWTCFLLMAPSGFTSEDLVWRVFNIVNFGFFSVVTAVVVIYRNGPCVEEKSGL